MVGVGRPARAALLAAAVVSTAALSGCVSTSGDGVVHVVRPGENVYRISRYYGVSVNDVIATLPTSRIRLTNWTSILLGNGTPRIVFT